MILTPHLALRNGSEPSSDADLAPRWSDSRELVVRIQDPDSAAPQTPDPSAAETVTRGRTPADSTLDGRGDPNGNGNGQGGVPPGCFDQQSMIFVLLFVGVIYFMMLRPQQKRDKELKEMRAAIKKGDKAVTSAGIHGIVDSLTEETVTLKVDADVRLTFDRAAIARTDDDGSAASSTPAQS